MKELSPQIQPDWIHVYSSAEAVNNDLLHFEFKGPGIYHDKNSFLIITAVLDFPRPGLPDNPWANAEYWPEGTRWRVHVYNVPIEDTIFDWRISVIPRR